MLNTMINNNLLNTDLVSDLKTSNVVEEFETQMELFRNWRQGPPLSIKETQKTTENIEKDAFF